MSHIEVMATQILCSFCFLMVLFSVDALSRFHKDARGLSCVNDFVNNVSCIWNSSPGAPGVDCWISGVKNIWILKNNIRLSSHNIQRCKMKQRENSHPGCSFIFENEKFNTFETMPNISMDCNGTLVEKLTNYRPCSHIKMHPPGVPNVSRTDNETWIMWSPSGPLSYLFKTLDFQLQVKQKKQTWKEAKTLSTQELELRIPSSQQKGHFQVRVRVKPTNWPYCNGSHWSNWSPATSWVAATDVASTPQDQEWLQTSLLIFGVVFCLSFIIFIMLVLYRNCTSRSFRYLKGKPVPNPSKYFHTLHSVHEGNLKKWMNPLSVQSEAFFTAQPCDHISLVEVCESWDVVASTSPSSSSTSALLHFKSCLSAGLDTSGVVDNFSSSSSSCFSNMGYFISSSSSSSARTDPCPAYFTYKDDFHNLHLSLCPSLPTSSACESLNREPQSPDSGFGIGKEDEEDKEDKRTVNVEGGECLDNHHSSPLLILPFHLPSRICPPSSPPPTPNAPSLTQLSSDSQQVDVAVAAASGSYAAWPLAGAMCRSSSMPVEPCKTGYLTLKELQTTFSNKSI